MKLFDRFKTVKHEEDVRKDIMIICPSDKNTITRVDGRQVEITSDIIGDRKFLWTRDSWKNRARETLYSGCLLTLLDTKKRATKVAIKLTPARAILTGDFFRSFGFRPGRRGN